eukprot:3363609-Ditylum_brightwellii.AAC.1
MSSPTAMHLCQHNSQPIHPLVIGWITNNISTTSKVMVNLLQNMLNNGKIEKLHALNFIWDVYGIQWDI